MLKRLEGKGVALSADELETVTRVRRLRNDLQHGTAKFNHRLGLAVSRATIVFVDRFAQSELGLWAGDAISPDDWHVLLAIEQICKTAEAVAEERMVEVREQSEALVSSCERCGRDAMVRPHPRAGASCVFCRHVPVHREANGG